MTAEQQAVQIVMRGRRFETNVAVLTKYCGTFARFFASASQHNSADDGDPPLSEVLLKSIADEGMSQRLHVRRVVLEKDGATSSAAAPRFVFDFTKRADEECRSDALELQPDYTGAILVYLRKLFAAVSSSPPPRLSSKWSEMSRGEQRNFADIVVAFDVDVLRREGYDAPTAPHAEIVEPATASPADDAAAALLRAHAYLDEIARCPQNTAEGNPSAAMGGAPQHAGASHPSVIDDGLELPATACYKCGTTGHDAAQCKF